MKRQISLLAVFCLLLSLLPMSAWATTPAELGLTQVFGLTITENTATNYEGKIIAGNSMKADATVVYPAARTYRPLYGETPGGVPYASFASLNSSNTRDGNDRFVSVEVDVDDATTAQHETIADMDIAIEMWIRPYASGVKQSTHSGYGIFNLTDSVTGTSTTVGTTRAIDHGVIAGATPWFGRTFIPCVEATSTTNSTAIAAGSANDYGTLKDVTAYAGLNDGEWVHFVITRCYLYDKTTGAVSGLRQSSYVNGKFIGNRNLSTSDGNSLGNYKSLTSDGSTYLNYNMVTLGKGGGFIYPFIGDIAACNIYTADWNGDVSAAKSDGMALYGTSTLTSKMCAASTATATLTNGVSNTLTVDNIASATSVAISATVPEFIEHTPAATLDSTSTISMALAVGYDANGAIACTQKLTGTVDFVNKQTTLAGTMTVPTGKTLNDVKVFVWDNANDLRPITLAWSLR